MKAIVRLVHKTCPSWGVTACGLQLYQRRPPKTVERWGCGVACPKCLRHKPNAPDQARLQLSPEAGCSVDELTDGIQQAITMLMDHIDQYHDCDVPENTEGPPERKALQNIMHHLMGTITPNEKAEVSE